MLTFRLFAITRAKYQILISQIFHEVLIFKEKCQSTQERSNKRIPVDAVVVSSSTQTLLLQKAISTCQRAL